jgi:CubicO group peptidase (beta-lactamase class C family)
MRPVDHLMRQAISDSVFPGAVLLVSKKNDVRFFKAYGCSNIFSKALVTTDTVFDLASLTKPLATALAVMLLVQRGRIELEQNLGSLLPAFKNSDKSSIKLKHLLYHNSGLVDYRPYYKTISDLPPEARLSALRKCLLNEPLMNPIGKKVLYSDLGFMILRWVVEAVSGCRLDHFVTDEIYNLLALKDLYFTEPGKIRPEVNFAATEECIWRQMLLEGQVHDENAFILGGIEGHAGLFGTAQNVYVLLSDLLSSYHGYHSIRLLQKDIVRAVLKRLPDTDKALGFDAPSVRDSSSGQYFSQNSVGHLGFTGTSFWMDLDREIIVILLTNRVHPTRAAGAIKAFRPQLHDAVMKLLL